MQPLPIDPFLPELVKNALERGSVVISAEPGAGKTTRVPPAFLSEVDGGIVVLEPRRLAARLSADRVAKERESRLGDEVGYEVRFDRKVSKSTRLKFITEGILTRQWESDPDLQGTSVLIFDEFHERHLHSDVSLALARGLQRRLGKLKIVVMSATLSASALTEFLGCDAVSVPGRTFPVTVEHQEAGDARPLERKVAAYCKRALRRDSKGDILVFLPGAREIYRAANAVSDIEKSGFAKVHLLHGDLPFKDQDRAVSPSSERKVILSTNIAETSLTLPSVTTVIDSGLSRTMIHSPFTGLPSLVTVPTSQASSVQRAGRAGRTAAGHCYRLFSEHDFHHRRDRDVPEIARAELSELALLLFSLSEDPTAFSFFEAPPVAALEAALALLRDLSAIAESKLTSTGRAMAKIPAHPRLARLLLEAQRRRIVDLGALGAALMGERDIRLAARGRGEGELGDRVGASDVLEQVEAFEEVERSNFGRDAIRHANLDSNSVRSVHRVRDQLLKRLPRSSFLPEGPGCSDEEQLAKCVLVAFSDRVGRRRTQGGNKVVFAKGAAELHPNSVVKEAEFLVALDVQEIRGTETIRTASAIEPEWLLELFEERIEEHDERTFDRKTETVLRSTSLRYAGLTIESSSKKAPADETTARVLADAVSELGLGCVCDEEAADRLISRCLHARLHSDAVPELSGQSLSQLIAELALGCRSLDELRSLSPLSLLVQRLPTEARKQLDRFAPERARIPGRGNGVIIHYPVGRDPFIESALQDFFGLKTGPRIGSESLLLHLLAPNKRALQVTKDLESFWARHYPDLRRSLSRRYSRHFWPEDPTTAPARRFKPKSAK